MINNPALRIGYPIWNGDNGVPNGENGDTNSWWTWAVGIWNWLVGSGFFEQGVWAEELVGQLTDDSATGGPLDLLEEMAGTTFPDLQTMRQGVVDAWRAWQRSFWNRRAMLDAYKMKCKEFAEALDARKIEYFGGVGPTPVAGIWDFFKKYWPYLLVSGIAVTGIGVTVALVRKK